MTKDLISHMSCASAFFLSDITSILSVVYATNLLKVEQPHEFSYNENMEKCIFVCKL